MQTSDFRPWPHGDVEQDAWLRGLVRLGLAEAVRIDGELHYRLLPPPAEALASAPVAAWSAGSRELAVE